MAGCDNAAIARVHAVNGTRVVVGPDHRISGTAPADVPAGEHEITITLPDRPDRAQMLRPLDPGDLPKHDLGPCPAALGLRREEIYGDVGR